MPPSKARSFLSKWVPVLAAALLSFLVLRGVISRAPGATIEVDARTKKTVVARAGERGNVQFKVTNHGSKTVTLHGLDTSCGCLTVTDMPIPIPPGQARPVDLVIATKPEQAGSVVRVKAVLYADENVGPIDLNAEVAIEIK